MSPEFLVEHATKTKELVVAAKAWNKQETQRFLDRNVLAKGYQPIHIFVENSSDKTFAFTKAVIDLPIVDPKEVAEKVHSSILARVFSGLAVSSTSVFFALPAAIFSAIALGPPGIILSLTLPVVAIGSSVRVVEKTTRNNDQIDQDYSSASDITQVIEANSSVSLLVFVKLEDYRSNFKINLIDLLTNDPVSVALKAS